jgi:hypothetical protein
MRTKEIRPSLDPETCAICERRLLQGEMQTRFVAPDGSRHIVCELCVPRADRARWVRERDGEQPLGPPPPPARRPGLIRRIVDWFAGVEAPADDAIEAPGAASRQPATTEVAGLKGEVERARRRSRLPQVDEAPDDRAGPHEGHAPVRPSQHRTVTAVPTDEDAKLQRGLELFNHSQFPRTIAGLTRSLGLPQVAVLHAGGNSVEIFVAWGISWYSYRVDLGDSTEPVELSGRGNDSAELDDVVGEWNVIADEGGVLVLLPGQIGQATATEPSEVAPESQGDTPEATPDEVGI